MSKESEVSVMRTRMLAGGGLLAVATASALVTIAVGGGFGGGTKAVAAATEAPSASPSATPSAAPSPTTASPTPAAPSPTPTVKGSVDGSSHSGDLRYFLLPVPDDAQAEGDINGTTMSLGDIANLMGNPSTSKSILNSYGFTHAAYRTYRTNDGTLTVTARLIQFDGPGHASDWVTGLSFSSGSDFTPDGVSNAKAVAHDPSSPEGVGLLEGISHVGDVEYEIDVEGTGKLDHSLLAPLMKREEQRLGTGR